jgi:threonine synthase
MTGVLNIGQSHSQSPLTRFGRLACSRCQSRVDLRPLVFGCPHCAAEGFLSVLEVLDEGSTPPRPLEQRHGKGLSRFSDLLPGRESDRLTLGEGDTALVRSRRIGPGLGFESLYFKNEGSNPTWSFKDRYVAVTLNLAREFGFRRVVVSSTGNLGLSTAAYCAAAGMECVLLTPPGAAPAILAQAQLHGAKVVMTTWEGRQVLFEHLARKGDWFPLGLFLPRPVHNPFGIEGYKTFAYEAIDALDEAPAAVLFPCARGNGLYGAWKGFCEAKRWGWIDDKPAMVACQPVGANSLEVSIRSGAATPVELSPITSVAFSAMETVADERALRAIRESHGAAFSATDSEILSAQRDLAAEGLFVEASSALPVACLPRLKAEGRIDARRPIVCILTAAGIQWADRLTLDRNALIEIPPDPVLLDRRLEAT